MLLRSVCIFGLTLVVTSSMLLADDAPVSDPSPRTTGGDMTFCELFDLRQFGRVGDIVGLSLATTSLNIGDAPLQWFIAPRPDHPFIVMNLYRLKDDRFEQIGQSWIKHGFLALNRDQCSIGCEAEFLNIPGPRLGVGCTDTYGSGTNANQGGLGPRYELNPWTGDWSFAGSHFADPNPPVHDAISHRLQVHDDDLDPTLNPGATYYAEGYYVMLDDIDVMNSAAWKPVTPVGAPGGTWTFTMTQSSDPPNIGFAIDAWAGATHTTFAQEVPPVEFVSPDGRCILAAKATDVGNDYWRYEYALLNIDMDRQVGELVVPVSSCVDVRNIGFHAVRHHDEPMNEPGGVAIDNSPWNAAVCEAVIPNDNVGNAVCWSTTTNPLRWGTLYNFHFEAKAPPVTDAELTIGHFKPGTPTHITAVGLGPSLTSNDSDGDGICNGDDNCPNDPDNDADNDGVCGDMDICPGFDDRVDADNDGTPDGCDECPGFDDRIDTDGDGTPDDCDECPGFDDRIDADNDGTPDDCDECAGFDDRVDADNDGTPDGCDECAGFDDRIDADNDGAPDGCDECPNDPNDDTDGDGICDSDDGCPNDPNNDSDGDGICDSDDGCPNDPNNDSDNDGICDSDDECPNDPNNDADNDGICGDVDICPGFDDQVDTDGDGVPDGCDESPGPNPLFDLCAPQSAATMSLIGFSLIGMKIGYRRRSRSSSRTVSR